VSFHRTKFGGIGKKGESADEEWKEERRNGEMWAFGVDEGGRGEGRMDRIWEGIRREKWEGFEGGAADLGRNRWPKEKPPKNRMKTEWRRRRREGRRMSSRQKSEIKLNSPKDRKEGECWRWKKEAGGGRRPIGDLEGLGSFYQYGIGLFYQYAHKFTPNFHTILFEAMKVGS
jgi:hypothetical protein